MSTPTGQTILVDYQDSVNSNEVNDRLLHLASRGIYSGGYLTKVSDTSVSLSTLICEIGDANHQVRATTTATNTITVGVATSYVILRWAYVGAPSTAMTITAVSSPSANDLIVGKCIFAGSTLTGFDYSLRSNPNIFNKFLLVEPTETASMILRVRAGQISYGSSTISIVDQVTGTFIAPSANPRIDVITLDTSGTVSIITGTEAATPSAPDYQNKIALAEITLTVGMTTITASAIKNVQNAVRATGVPAGMTMDYAGNTIPAGYLLCDGSAVSRSTYSTLFAAIGTLWGVGDGSTTFNLPPAGIVAVGYKSGDTDFNVVGNQGGEKTHTLTLPETPIHTHTPTYSIGTQVGTLQGDPFAKGDQTSGNYSGTGSWLTNAGGGGAHNNLQPYGVFKKIIKY